MWDRTVKIAGSESPLLAQVPTRYLTFRQAPSMHYRIHPSPNIGARSFGDEVVVANFVTGVYYSLLGSAAQVWEV
jgi:hypothetical protein